MAEQAQTHQDPDSIQSDIHRTREQIDRTLDAVQHKLSPGELLQEVIGMFRRNGDNTGSTNSDHPSMPLGSKAGELMSGLGRTIKDNPVPSALIGIGLIGLVRGSDSHGTSSNGFDRAESSQGFGDKAKQAVHELGDEVRDLGEGELGDKLDDARERVGDKLDDARERIGDKLDDARETVERGYERVRDRVEDNPIVLGALGVALGAALGASLPSTRVENRLMGDKRDELASKAKQVGEQVREAVTQDGHEATSSSMSGAMMGSMSGEASNEYDGPSPS
jgi:ElaB/YqjD/DUF883 family membrane-anchored ribosome-binding protein